MIFRKGNVHKLRNAKIDIFKITSSSSHTSVTKRRYPLSPEVVMSRKLKNINQHLNIKILLQQIIKVRNTHSPTLY